MGQKDFYFTLVSIDLLYKLKKSAQKSWAIPSLYFASKEHLFERGMHMFTCCTHVKNKNRPTADEKGFKAVSLRNWNKILTGFGRFISMYRYNHKCLRPSVKYIGGFVMVWECISASCVGDFVPTNGIMNSL